MKIGERQAPGSVFSKIVGHILSKHGDPGGGPALKMAPVRPIFMRIWPTACVIWSENRILGQKAISGVKLLFSVWPARTGGRLEQDDGPAISSETTAPCYHVVTDFSFDGFF